MGFGSNFCCPSRGDQGKDGDGIRSPAEGLSDLSGRDLPAVMLHGLGSGHIGMGVLHIVPVFGYGQIEFQLRLVPEPALKLGLLRYPADGLPDFQKPGFHGLEPGDVGTLLLTEQITMHLYMIHQSLPFMFIQCAQVEPALLKQNLFNGMFFSTHTENYA
jgi:hypothetical protein